VPTSIAGFTTITFSAAGTTLAGFAGADDSQIVGDPECGPASANRVMQVGRSPTAMVFAGPVVSTLAGSQVPRIAFSAGNTVMTMRTRSAVSGIRVRLKLEDAADMSRAVEAETSTTVANAWETLRFDFANQVTGTPPLNFATTYNKVIVFFDFGTAGSAANSRTYFADDIAFIGGGATPDGGSAGGSAGGGTAGGSTAGGLTAGGSTAGGSTAGGSTAGGSTAGGSTAGGSTAGGSTAGGSTAGGSTAGGSTAGGSTAGGSTAGGSTAGGSTAGGSTAGGSADGGVAPFAVFVDDFRAGSSFVDFQGSINAVTRDTTNPNNGRASLRVVGPSSSYTGGAIVSAAPVDLRAYNVITFWAKASASTTVPNIGFGDTANASSGPLIAEFHTTVIGTAWTKYTFPIPNPTAVGANRGLFFFAGGINAGTTVWFNDVQFEAVSPAVYSTAVGVVTNVSVAWPGARMVQIGSPYQLDFNPNTVFWTSQTGYRIGWNYFSLRSSNPGVATVNADGLISAADAGMAVISANPFGGFTVPGSVTITVPGGSGPTAPTAAATDPGARLPNQVVSLYTSSGIYMTRPIDTFGTSWSNGGAGPFLTDFTIPGTTRVVKRYATLNFVGWESLNANPHINVPGTWTLHMSVWTGNATTFSVKLVTFVAPGGGTMGGTNGPEFQFNFSGLAQGQWNELNVPLSAFTGVDTTHIGQIIIANNFPTLESGTFFLDNIYFFQ
jgi:hypothetical protein